MGEFDVAVIGGGIAGFSASVHAAELGAKVCLIEKSKIGGTSSKRFYPLRIGVGYSREERSRFFEDINGNIETIMNEWLQTIAEKKIALKIGNGVLINNTEVLVQSVDGEEVVKAGKIIVATGSAPVSISSMPFDGENIFSQDDVFALREIPENILIVGGDRVGCEIATLFSRWGCKVIVCDERPHVLADQDTGIIALLEEEMKKQKIKLVLNRKPVSMYKDGDQIDITLDGEIKFSTNKIVLAGMRKANTAALGVAKLGLRVGDRGEILVNENMETSATGVYAVGSVTGGNPDPLISEEGGRIAVKNALGKPRPLNPDHIPVIIYTDPEVASVGVSAQNAHYKGYRAVEGVYDYNKLNRPSLRGETAVGRVKVAADKTTKKVIGVHIIGRNASEVISLAALAVKKGLMVSDLATLSCGWPTRYEGLKRAARACLNALSAKQR